MSEEYKGPLTRSKDKYVHRVAQISRLLFAPFNPATGADGLAIGASISEGFAQPPQRKAGEYAIMGAITAWNVCTLGLAAYWATQGSVGGTLTTVLLSWTFGGIPCYHGKNVPRQFRIGGKLARGNDLTPEDEAFVLERIIQQELGEASK